MGGTDGVLDADFKKILMQNLGALAGVQGSIVSAAEGRQLRTILVTSCNRGEGKTVTSIGMAYSLANHDNAEVLLVEGNLADPRIHELFGVPASPGLTDYLTADIGLDKVVRPTEDSRLLLLPHGGATTTLFDVTRTQALKQRLATLREKFDYVICDGSAIASRTDASLIAGLFDGIVLVVECERTRWEVVQMAKERITKAGGTILGVVLNKRRFYIPRALYGGG